MTLGFSPCSLGCTLSLLGFSLSLLGFTMSMTLRFGKPDLPASQDGILVFFGSSSFLCFFCFLCLFSLIFYWFLPCKPKKALDFKVCSTPEKYGFPSVFLLFLNSGCTLKCKETLKNSRKTILFWCRAHIEIKCFFRFAL